MTWRNGRELDTVTTGGKTYSYEYDINNLRTSKTVDGVTHYYIYAGGKLLRKKYGTRTLDFIYDSNGNPYALIYNGTTYYYITNLQGDVMYMVDANGATVATYEYDPYGKIINSYGAMAEINPLRYRGYYYDSETGFYYLQSRYYDPEICRFINADGLASTGQGFVGQNMFAYCLNNPIIFGDSAGCDAYILIDKQGAVTFGHMGFIVQDEEGNWWHFYWGPSTYAQGAKSLFSGCNVPTSTYCVRIELDEVTLDAINSTDQYGGNYDDMIYLAGDFSDVIPHAKDQSSEYNIYNNNCAQVSLTLLIEAGTPSTSALEHGRTKHLRIPNLMFNDIKNYIEPSYNPSSGPGGSGRGTYSAFR